MQVVCRYVRGRDALTWSEERERVWSRGSGVWTAAVTGESVIKREGCVSWPFTSTSRHRVSEADWKMLSSVRSSCANWRIALWPWTNQKLDCRLFYNQKGAFFAPQIKQITFLHHVFTFCCVVTPVRLFLCSLLSVFFGHQGQHCSKTSW